MWLSAVALLQRRGAAVPASASPVVAPRSGAATGEDGPGRPFNLILYEQSVTAPWAPVGGRMDWQAVGPYLLMFTPVLAGIVLAIVTRRMTRKP